MNADVMFSSKTDLWETPQDFFDELDREFHFELDVCALPENAKCARYYGTGRFISAVEGCLLVQPSVWTGDRFLGSQRILCLCGGGNSSYASASKDRHKMVS